MQPEKSMRNIIGRIGVWLLVIFLLPILYVLSIGPAVRLLRAGVPEECLAVWKPIRPFCDSKKPLGRILLRYQAWWLGDEYREPARRASFIERKGMKRGGYESRRSKRCASSESGHRALVAIGTPRRPGRGAWVIGGMTIEWKTS